MFLNKQTVSLYLFWGITQDGPPKLISLNVDDLILLWAFGVYILAHVVVCPRCEVLNF